MKLTAEDRSKLAGEAGDAVALAMRMVVEVAESMGASSLVDIVGAHIDGCLFHGVAGMDFAERLAQGAGRVAVPTTLNVTSFDLLHPELYRGSEEERGFAVRLMDAYVEMGCEPTWTCAPYQLVDRPELGDQIAWGESNAIVFANSVLGARTNRYGDFMDICCAITGRAPLAGLHTDEGRLATTVVELRIPEEMFDDDIVYPLIGDAVGRVAGTEVVTLVGLPGTTSEDQLKAVGAAAASSGAVAMFHAVGVTPEAVTLDESLGGRQPGRTVGLSIAELHRSLAALDSRRGDTLGAVSVGTPHMSEREMRQLVAMTEGRHSIVPFYVNTSRAVLDQLSDVDWRATLESFGATIVTDTCTYLAPMMEPVDGDVMTNSGKWAFYAPANLGVGVMFGSLADCVRAAEAGRPVASEL